MAWISSATSTWSHIRVRLTRLLECAFDVEADHPAYDDPEWAADAASGALTNEYGLVAIHTDLRGPDLPVRQ